MTRIAGLSLIGVILATIVFFFMGYLWFGAVFTDVWSIEILRLRGIVEPGASLSSDQLRATFIEAFPDLNPALGLGLGFVNALLTTTVLAIVLRIMKADGLLSHIGYGLLAWLGFAVTSFAYDPIYGLESMTLFWLDVTHGAAAYSAAAAVLSFFSRASEA
ncbi:MAG: DUF1761 domain-containing protein [Pseudomonadota bacterium]